MKISLDAAMRARDVSSSGWGDDDSPDRDKPENTAAATAGGVIHAGIAGAVSDAGVTERTAESEASQPAESEASARAGSRASGPAESEASAPAESEANQPAASESVAIDSERVVGDPGVARRAVREPFANRGRRRRRKRLQRGDPT